MLEKGAQVVSAIHTAAPVTREVPQWANIHHTSYRQTQHQKFHAPQDNKSIDSQVLKREGETE